MRAVNTLLRLLALAWLTGCSCQDPAPADPSAPPPSSGPATSVPVPPPSSGPGPVAHTPPPPPATLTPEQRAATVADIAEGRRLSAAGDWAGASTHFQAALERAPGDARLRCEAGLVALRAGDATRAAELVEGVADDMRDDPPDALRVPTAMCLYNLGLVAEANGDAEAARTDYARSLALRPNETVQQHLDALGGAPAGADDTEPVRPGLGADLAVAEGADDATIRATIRAAECGDGSDGEECEAQWAEPTLPAGEGGEGLEARIETLSGLAMGNYLDRGYLVLRAGAARLVAVVADGYQTGMGRESSAPSLTRFAYADLVPGGSPEVVLAVDESYGDDDWCESYYTNDTVLYVCTADGGLRCIALVSHYEDGITTEGATGEGEDDCETFEPIVHAVPSTAVLEGSSVTIATTGTIPSSWPEAALVGAHPVSELLGHAELRWPTPPSP